MNEIIKDCLNELKAYAENRYENIDELKKEYENNIIFIYQDNDIYEYDTSKVYEEIPNFPYIMYENLFTDFAHFALDDEEDDELTKDELLEWYYDSISSFRFFKLKQKTRARKLNSIINIIKKYNFCWMPITTIIYGKWYGTYHLPAEDKDGNIIGLRF